MDETLQHLTAEMFCALPNLLEDSQFFFQQENELEDWPDVTKCNVEEAIFPLIFQEVLSSIPDVLVVWKTGPNSRNGRAGGKWERRDEDN